MVQRSTDNASTPLSSECDQNEITASDSRSTNFVDSHLDTHHPPESDRHSDVYIRSHNGPHYTLAGIDKGRNRLDRQGMIDEYVDSVDAHQPQLTRRASNLSCMSDWSQVECDAAT